MARRWPQHVLSGWNFPTLAAVILLLSPVTATAHGIWGHVHVTGWAIENLPPSELRDFFDDPDVMNAALFGAAFTDSGYWPQAEPLSTLARAYTEHSHWEPFVSDFIAWIAENDPPPWDSLESRQRVAFLMGCAAHGLQDEIFDSLFLYQVSEHDGAGQSEADPATDGFLVLDGHVRFEPTEWLPMDTLLELYAALDQDITEDVVQDSVDILTSVYLNYQFGVAFAEANGNTYLDQIPWTAHHYLDPEIPGSLRAEITPTGQYLEALWQRLRRGAADVVIATYPELPRRLLSGDSNSPDSWVTLIFAEGVDVETVESTFDHLGDPDTPVAFTQRGTRWGHEWTRLVRLQPDETLLAGDRYRVVMQAGASLLDGGVSEAPFELTFQVACAEPNPDLCPDISVDVPTIDPPDPPLDGDVGADTSGDTGTAELDSDGVSDNDSSFDIDSTSGQDGANSPTQDVPDDAEGGCQSARGPDLAPCGFAVAMLALVANRRRRKAR